MATQPEQNAPKNLRVLHTQVDGFTKGSVITRDQLPQSADIQRLISIGAVEEVKDAPVGEEVEGPHKTAREQKALNDGLDDLTVVDLKDKAKDAEITGYSNMTKAELIEALRAAKAK